MTDREIMQRALEALELAKNSHGVLLLSDPPQDPWKTRRVDSALMQSIAALRDRLAQPEQEPATKAGELKAMRDAFWKQPEHQAPRSDYRDWDYQDQVDAQESVAHCEAGPEHCPVCHKESSPAQQPLTKDELRDGARKTDPGGEDLCHWSFECGVRFAEAEHGIKEGA